MTTRQDPQWPQLRRMLQKEAVLIAGWLHLPMSTRKDTALKSCQEPNPGQIRLPDLATMATENQPKRQVKRERTIDPLGDMTEKMFRKSQG
jgi:hypothetical protein